jgi:lysozyme family protein
MAAGEFDKRWFLRVLGTAAFGLAIGQRAVAQDTRILGLDVPKGLADMIPRKPMSFLRIADAVIALEREADRKGLPQSPLELGNDLSLRNLTDSLYQLAMPRLVALVDRAGAIDSGFADKAGELLAELHQSQHELPELLQLLPKEMRVEPPAGPGLRYLMQPDPASGGFPTGLVFPPYTPPSSDASPEPEASTEPDIEPPSEPSVPSEEPDQPLSTARDYASLKSEYGRMFRKLEIRPQFRESADWHLAMMRRSRGQYQRVEAATGVPWHFIAATHALEASFNFRAHLHNGDFPLSARTRQVPSGRPSVWLPPSDWDSSAKDALGLLGYVGQTDWSLERTLYRLEAYNGLGYRRRGVPTPYLWSFSNHYDRGKFIADGRFSATARSQQCGAAVMLKLLQDAGEITLEAAT